MKWTELIFFPFPPSPPGFSISGPDKGVLFFVTSEQYDLFNEELYQIGKQTVFVNEYVRLSAVSNSFIIKYPLSHTLKLEKE